MFNLYFIRNKKTKEEIHRLHNVDCSYFKTYEACVAMLRWYSDKYHLFLRGRSSRMLNPDDLEIVVLECREILRNGSSVEKTSYGVIKPEKDDCVFFQDV